MAEIPKYEFLDSYGVLRLAEDILNKVNQRIEERIVQTIDDNSDKKHVPSAQAIYNAIASFGTRARLQTVEGLIDTITNPRSDTIYLQRDDDSDRTWLMYVYDSDIGWICIGDTSIDLANYWSKSDDDISELRETLGVNTLAEDKVEKESMVRITDSEIINIISTAFDNTEVFNDNE